MYWIEFLLLEIYMLIQSIPKSGTNLLKILIYEIQKGKNLPAEVLKSGTQDCWKPYLLISSPKHFLPFLTITKHSFSSHLFPNVRGILISRYQTCWIPETLKKRNGCYFTYLQNAVYVYQFVVVLFTSAVNST